jgi:hypothetical protein
MGAFMSDILLIGALPENKEGEEFYLHIEDSWWEMLFVMNNLLIGIYQMDEYFYPDKWLAPPTPHLEGKESRCLAELIDESLQNGSIESLLRKINRVNPEINEKSLLIGETIEGRLKQFKQFVDFLRYSGGVNPEALVV